MTIKLTANINNQIEEISQQIESLLKGTENKNNVSYFQSTEHNFDAMQNLNMNESKKELERTVEKNKIDYNEFSIADAKDYLGCIGNQCKNIENDKNIENIENIENQKTDFRENPMLNNNFMDNNISRENKEENNNSNNFIHTLDYIVSFVYIFLVSVLLISSILNKKNNNLVYILLLTLVFIFYKIYFVKS